MELICQNRAAAERAERVLIKASARYTRAGEYIGTNQIRLLVNQTLDKETILRLEAIPGVRVQQ